MNSSEALEDPTQPMEQHVTQKEASQNHESLELPISRRLRRARKPTLFFLSAGMTTGKERLS
ncbi:unnamed protein product [Clavelina lepadiformis]|uniref:Uncharacterized protein n=1 Tax=Clavelina lepadiformis TaxID=159417 RepID=A0ABP0G1B3_CLALP